MNIEQLAREAGATGMVHAGTAPDGPITAFRFSRDNGSLERFAALVRNEALEEAAVKCDEKAMFAECASESDTIYDCAAAIRSMKEVKT